MIHSVANLARLLLLATMLAAPVSAMADAGVVSFVAGDAFRIESDGTRSPISKGMPIDQGDRIATGLNGRVELLMSDGGLIALRPDTEFIVDSFSYAAPQAATPTDPPAPSGDKSFFSLLKGGLRSVTGAVGESNKEAYRMNTPVATIGIRGTDYVALYCTRVCGSNNQLPRGLHLMVVSGAVEIGNDAGKHLVLAGETGFVKDRESEPVAGVDPSLLFAEFDWLLPPDDYPDLVSEPDSQNLPEQAVAAESAAEEASAPTGVAFAATQADGDGTPVVVGIPGAGSANTAGPPAVSALTLVLPGATTISPKDVPGPTADGGDDLQDAVELGEAVIGPNGTVIDLTSGSAEIPGVLFAGAGNETDSGTGSTDSSGPGRSSESPARGGCVHGAIGAGRAVCPHGPASPGR